MDTSLPRQVDTVIVGNGPSALILSYILHGHIPVYDLDSPHPDNLLHEKLKDTQDLLDIDVDYLTEHFYASQFSYSTQALPINVLLDTLLRPSGETDDIEHKSCVKWRYDPARAVPHLVVGSTAQTGGQWGTDAVKTSWDIRTLSYAGMLSLPGYDFAQFYLEQYGEHLPLFSRPTRRQVAKYFALYPNKVGIDDAICYGETLSGIQRAGPGFYISSHKIICNHLVLATGVFTSPIPPPALLSSLPTLQSPSSQISSDPILVIGSGFSAADVILSTKPEQEIIHVYKWSPSKAPSPLKACHQQAYPEYAGVYRKMKLAAIASKQSRDKRPGLRRASSSAFDASRDWQSTYEGLPNTSVVSVDYDTRGATVTFQTGGDPPFTRRVSRLAYVVGRRGSLEYLDSTLQKQVCPSYERSQGLSSRYMREKANEDLEVSENVFVIGSMTGDTLVRFSYGGCAYTAARIMEDVHLRASPRQDPQFRCMCNFDSGRGGPHFIPSMKGLDGHYHEFNESNDTHGDANALDRRKTIMRRGSMISPH